MKKDLVATAASTGVEPPSRQAASMFGITEQSFGETVQYLKYGSTELPEWWNEYIERLRKYYLDRTAILQCDKCGRKSYGGENGGSYCEMPQPGGLICSGILSRAE